MSEAEYEANVYDQKEFNEMKEEIKYKYEKEQLEK